MNISNLLKVKTLSIYSLLFSFLFTLSYTSDAQCLTRKRNGVHVVQPKENLYRISKKYKVSVENICKWNNIKINDPLHKCQELIVSGSFSSEESPTSFSNDRGNSTKQNNQENNKHTVRSGENIASIAKKYGYTEERFREFNALSKYEETTVGSILLSSDCVCDRISNNYSGASKNNSRPATTPRTTTNPKKKNTQPRTNPSSKKPSNFEPSTKAVAKYMSAEEMTMIDEINLMRSNPKAYIKHVRAYADDQKNNGGFPISDQVVNELIQELNDLSSLSQLKPTECIYRAAKKHGDDIIKMGDTNHQGSDGKWPWDRVRRECPQMADGNENLVGGPDKVRESVIILLIDDGIPTRGHRKTLLKKEWKYVACHKIGKVGIMPNCWVQKFGY